MARPKKPPEELRFGSPRLTVSERVKVEHAAAAHGLSLSEFLRRRALGYRMPPHVAEQQTNARLAAALFGLGHNLNQIARHMNRGNTAPPELPALISRIQSELDRLHGPGDNGGRPIL